MTTEQGYMVNVQTVDRIFYPMSVVCGNDLEKVICECRQATDLICSEVCPA